MSGMNLTDFLLARIDEDEARARTAAAVPNGDTLLAALPTPLFDGLRIAFPVRVLAECAAKRAIIEFHKEWPTLVETEPTFDEPDLTPGDVSSMTLRMSKRIAWMTQREYVARFGVEPPTSQIMRALAAPYSDHPDFDPSWRVDLGEKP